MCVNIFIRIYFLIYAIKKNLKSKFYIIDHKLRNESTKEAKFVSNLLRKNFIKSKERYVCVNIFYIPSIFINNIYIF